jgi:hypothetical protein
MASRAYAIKSNKHNLDIGEECILAKFKPNMEHDLYFFDDEEVIAKSCRKIGLILPGIQIR